MSSSSVYKETDVPNYALYYDDVLFFQTNPTPNSWFCIDYKKFKVNLSHYSLKSNCKGGPGGSHPQSWDIEGSNDLKNWEVLDKRSQEKSLDDRSASNTFKIQNIHNKYYRYIRIIQRGLNTRNMNNLVFSAIEFFGDVQYSK